MMDEVSAPGRVGGNGFTFAHVGGSYVDLSK